MSVVTDNKHILIESENTFSENSLKVSLRSDGGISISVDNPWAGDSESGFGRDADIDLTPAEFEALALWFFLAARRKP